MRKVLVIDDSSTVRFLVKLTLEKNGFTVIEAENGREGLEKLQNENPEIIFCDINMPVLDGMGFLKEHGKLENNIPVIMLTTEASDEYEQAALNLGAKKWMKKPFTQEKIMEVVNSFIAVPK